MRPQVYIPPRIELFREVVGDPTHEFANLRRELHRVERENAKLREFVQYVADGVYKGLFCCDKCRFFAGCYNDEKKEHDGRGCQWLLWSRELGIEVDK